MRPTIKIRSVDFPLEQYAINGTALLGIRGGGKTYTAKGIAEQLLEHRIPIVVFDPIGQWQHLRRARPGKGGKGFELVVAGGAAPDLPLTADSAAQIVRAAIRENIPLVIDLYDRKLSKADWRKIVQTCFRTLLYENQGVRHIFLEETAEFAPQKVQDGQTYAEVEKLVRMGGNASLGITLINQRAQEVNKAVLDLCENLVLMRQRGAHAIEALTKWLDKLSPDFAKRIAADMPTLEAGECWVFAGEAEHPVKTRSAQLRSFHPDRTRPELAAKAEASVVTADLIQRLSGELEVVIERAKADDPQALRNEISKLRHELRLKHAAATPPEDAARIVQLEHDNAALEQHRDRVVAAFDRLRAMPGMVLDVFEMALNDARKVLAAAPSEIPRFPQITKTSPPAPRAKQVPARPARPNGHDSAPPADGLTKGQIAVLSAIVQHPEGVDAGQLTLLAGYARSTRDRLLQELRSLGLVAPGWPARATDAAIAALGDAFEPLPTGDALREWWLQRLDQGGRSVLEALASIYPAGIDRDELGARTGYARSTRDRLLQELAARKLIEKRGREVFASAGLFE